MRFSPLDIRKQDFTRSFRGFDEQEVAGFLESLSRQWEEVLDEQRRSQERLRELEGKLAHYVKVEEALQEALSMARDNAQAAKEHAERTASLTIKEAETRAADIVRDAEASRKQATGELRRLESKQEEIVSRLRAFLQSEMELLSHFDRSGSASIFDASSEDEEEGVEAPPHEPGEDVRGADDAREFADADSDLEDEAAQGESESAVETRAEEDEAPEEQARPTGAERPGHGWKVTPIVSEDSAERDRPRDQSGDMEKIRRILDDLD